MAGGVKNFCWERFGAAWLFSSLNDAASIAASEVSDADNVTRVPSQASDPILRDTMQIQPVLRIHQGADVGLLVARSFDFSTIYGLRLPPRQWAIRLAPTTPRSHWPLRSRVRTQRTTGSAPG